MPSHGLQAWLLHLHSIPRICSASTLTSCMHHRLSSAACRILRSLGRVSHKINRLGPSHSPPSYYSAATCCPITRAPPWLSPGQYKKFCSFSSSITISKSLGGTEIRIKYGVLFEKLPLFRKGILGGKPFYLSVKFTVRFTSE